MKRLLLSVALVLFVLPALAQQVVVFKDHRSMVVESYAPQGEWVLLRVGGGEISVRSDQIFEIRDEGKEASEARKAAKEGAKNASRGGRSADEEKAADSGRGSSRGKRGRAEANEDRRRQASDPSRNRVPAGGARGRSRSRDLVTPKAPPREGPKTRTGGGKLGGVTGSANTKTSKGNG